VDIVGVRRPWRKRGLGLALLRQAFAESLTGAPRLYGRAGMHVRESYVIHLKELRPGFDLGARSDAH
jgi:mycothiol synthase